jgi:hypothetical protein
MYNDGIKISVNQKKFMKNIFYLGFCIVLLSCKKKSEEVIQPLSESIQGIWELDRVWGSFIMNFPPGNGDIIIYSKDTFERYRDGQLIRSGKYELVEDNNVNLHVDINVPQNLYKHRIVYDENFDNPGGYVGKADGKLHFIWGTFANDAGSLMVYRRINSNFFLNK